MKSFHTNFLLFLTALSSVAVIQAQPIKFIPLNVDYAVFNAREGYLYVEVYLSCMPSALKYVETDSGLVSHFNIKLTVSNEQSVVVDRTQNFINIVRSTEEIYPGTELRHLIPLKLPPGQYRLQLQFTDINSGSRGEYQLEMELSPVSGDQMTMSDIELSVKITKDEGSDKFCKNGLRVIPNPSGIYSISLPVMYYYAEVYNLPYSPETPGTYTLESYISDDEGNIVRNFPRKQNRKPGASAVLVGGNNIVTLKPDSYLFSIRLTDDLSGKTVERSRPFTLFKPSKEQLAFSQQRKSAPADKMKSYYLKFTETQLDEEFEKAGYLASKDEIKIYENLDRGSKADFLAEFWRRRDPDPATPENEFKAQYFQLIQYASANFRTQFKEGWKTDRGRVLLIYGTPSDVERSPSEQDSKPYEIWTYNELEGGSIFVFADLRGFGEYELLHSTYSKELRNPDWQRFILKRSGSAEDVLFYR